MKKKKSCWLFHSKVTNLQGFQLLHIGGKLLEAPKTRTIVKLVQCSDCYFTQEEFHEEVSSDAADQRVRELNESHNLKPDYKTMRIPSQGIDFI